MISWGGEWESEALRDPNASPGLFFFRWKVQVAAEKLRSERHI